MTIKSSPGHAGSFVLRTAGLLLIPACIVLAQEKPEIPLVDAGVGSCKATFTVQENQKPVFNAKIEVIVRYGAMGIRKTELQVGTDIEGRGRVGGLPEHTKKPLKFVIRHGELSKTILVNTADQCDATFDVDLASK